MFRRASCGCCPSTFSRSTAPSSSRSTDDRLTVRTLIDRAQHLGIATAAEWVDDEATARLLTAWGVDYLQGGLFGEPEAVLQSSTLHRMVKKARG